MLDWIQEVILTIGYPGIALLMILENIFPPLPSEIIMPFAGFVTGKGELSYFAVVLAGTLGSVSGTIPFYFIGQKVGEEKIKKWADQYGRWLLLSSKDIVRARQWFERHDKKAVFLGRLVPGIRTLISIPAGIEGMNFSFFVTLSLLGTGMWISTLTYVGKILGQNYKMVETYLNPISYIVLGGLLLAYIYYIITYKKTPSR